MYICTVCDDKMVSSTMVLLSINCMLQPSVSSGLQQQQLSAVTILVGGGNVAKSPAIHLLSDCYMTCSHTSFPIRPGTSRSAPH